MRARRLLSLSLLLAACTSDPTAPAAEGLVVIPTVNDAPEISGPDVHFRVENRTPETVYLARCGERIMAAVDVRRDGRWEVHRSDACQAALTMDPLRLAPGDTARGAQVVQREGRYRLRLGVSAAPGAAPVWIVASPEFTVSR